MELKLQSVTYVVLPDLWVKEKFLQHFVFYLHETIFFSTQVFVVDIFKIRLEVGKN